MELNYEFKSPRRTEFKLIQQDEDQLITDYMDYFGDHIFDKNEIDLKIANIFKYVGGEVKSIEDLFLNSYKMQIMKLQIQFALIQIYDSETILKYYQN